MNIAVIPARGGSKRIPRKNIKSFFGKPMIVWSIEAAKKSLCFDRIIVSTDDVEIASIAKQNGAEVPFIRPPELSDDYTVTSDVIAHAIRWCEQHDQLPALVCCIYATAPFVQPADIQRGLKLLNETGSDFSFTVTGYSFPIQRAIRITDHERVDMIQPEYFTTRSQDLEETYHDAGQFYWGRSESWLEGKNIFSTDSAPILLPRHIVQDIDTAEDWTYAEKMFQLLNSNEK